MHWLAPDTRIPLPSAPPLTHTPAPPAPAPAASIPVVGFNAVLMSEHFASFFVWMILHLVLLVQWIKALLPDQTFNMAKRLVLSSGLALVGGLLMMTITYVLRSPTLGWTGGWRCLAGRGVHAAAAGCIAAVLCWLVCSAGVLCWCALLVCSAGVLCWCALLVCSAGVLCWPWLVSWLSWSTPAAAAAAAAAAAVTR
jgi:hypothetical protein